MTEQTEPLPLAVTVPTACRISGLGRTLIYQLINAGELVALKVGRRRLVTYASIEALITGTAN